MSIKNEFDYLNQLSTAELQEIVRRDAESTDSEDSEVIWAVLSILVEREKADPSKQPRKDAKEAWEEFQKYYNTPEGSRRVLYDYPDFTPEHRQKRTTPLFNRAIALAATICIIFTLALPAFGKETVATLFGYWRNGLFAFLSNQADMPIDPMENYKFETQIPELQQIHDTVNEMGVWEPVVPMWIPDGFYLSTLDSNNTPNVKRLYGILKNETSIINFSVLIHQTYPDHVQYMNDSDPEIIEIAEVTHYLFANNDKWVVTWTAENVVCTISTNLEKETLISILKSVYTKGA